MGGGGARGGKGRRAQGPPGPEARQRLWLHPHHGRHWQPPRADEEAGAHSSTGASSQEVVLGRW